MSFGFPTTASAATVYSSDQCSSSGNSRCIMLNYNSGNGGWLSACFLSNTEISNYSGHYAGDGIQVHYVFNTHQIQYSLHYGTSGCWGGNGADQPVKNNAAAVGNNLASCTAVIHYNSGYGGAQDKFSAGTNGNLNSTLKNENASQSLIC
ncbi:hypothetical protein AMK33_32195 [Streptomyces sp. CB02400]|nr:hypothetical protein AMK33_32195 [Streptomyces sp. CB02400]